MLDFRLGPFDAKSVWDAGGHDRPPSARRTEFQRLTRHDGGQHFRGIVAPLDRVFVRVTEVHTIKCQLERRDRAIQFIAGGHEVDERGVFRYSVSNVCLNQTIEWQMEPNSGF